MVATPVHFGIQTPQEGVSYETLAAHWHEADTLGFDSVWLGEHHNSQTLYPTPLLGLAAITSRTRRLQQSRQA